MIRSRVLSVVFAGAIGLLPIVPPEHVHALPHADGRWPAVAHRHFELHGSLHDDHDPSLEDKDPPLTLKIAFGAAARITIAPPAALPAIVLPTSGQSRGVLAAKLVDQSIHGPPRSATRLRAPPAQLFL